MVIFAYEFNQKLNQKLDFSSRDVTQFSEQFAYVPVRVHRKQYLFNTKNTYITTNTLPYTPNTLLSFGRHRKI